jgi:hypothetical protein
MAPTEMRREKSLKFKSSVLRAGIAALVVAIVAPISWAWADDRFPDVPSNNSHHANINAIADAGITLGCGGGNYCPSDFVRRDQMASFLARLGGLGNNTRVANGRGSISSYCASVAARPASFEAGPCMTRISTLESTDTTGIEPSIALDSNGNPVIGFLVPDGEAEVSRVYVARCGDASCDSHAVAFIGFAGIGSELAIGIGIDGNVLAVYSAGPASMKLSHCDDPSCTSYGTLALPFGLFPSLAIGRDGRPVVTFRDAAGHLQLVQCTAFFCEAPVPLDESGDVGEYNSVAIGADGAPIVSYYDRGNGDLKVARCDTSECAAPTSPVTLVTEGNVGSHSSIAIGIDGVPVIAHHDFSNGTLVLSRCTSAACTAASPPLVLDNAGTVGRFNSVAIAENGVPIVSTYDAGSGDLHLARCTTPTCTAAAPVRGIDGVAGWDVGVSSSLAVGVDGVPVIAYHDVNRTALKFARVPS